MGIGFFELVIVLVVGLLLLAMAIGGVVVLVLAVRKPRELDAAGDLIAHLRAENEQLRSELAMLRNRPQT
ncbi:MAG: hypothetical protein U0939_14125 [Pirellulales bacterium]